MYFVSRETKLQAQLQREIRDAKAKRFADRYFSENRVFFWGVPYLKLKETTKVQKKIDIEPNFFKNVK